MQKNLKKRDKSRVTKGENELVGFFLTVNFCNIYLFFVCLEKRRIIFQNKKQTQCLRVCVSGQENIHREAKEKECHYIVNIEKKKKKKKVVYGNTHGQTSQHLYRIVKRNRFSNIPNNRMFLHRVDSLQHQHNLLGDTCPYQVQ